MELQEPEFELTGNFDQGKGNLVRVRNSSYPTKRKGESQGKLDLVRSSKREVRVDRDPSV